MKKIKILVVDDDFKWTSIVCSELRRTFKANFQNKYNDYELEIQVVGPTEEGEYISNGPAYLKEATELVETEDFDFVISDWNIGNNGSLPDSFDLHTEPLILLLLEKEIPFRLLSGSGFSVIQFIDEHNLKEFEIYKVNRGWEDTMIPLLESIIKAKELKEAKDEVNLSD
jgi:hypothetical protein